jgi:DNA-binding NarL/FixJ family response regulator
MHGFEFINCSWTLMPPKVFLVEDMPIFQRAITARLKAMGDFTIAGCATTEAEANLWLEENPEAWQLAVLDLVLEQGSGFTVIRNCRKKSAGGKIVVLSSYMTPVMQRHCTSLGADAAFSKSDLAAFTDYCAELTFAG